MKIYLATLDHEEGIKKGNNFLFSFYDIYYSSFPFRKKIFQIITKKELVTWQDKEENQQQSRPVQFKKKTLY